jgi:hypothetical protein
MNNVDAQRLLHCFALQLRGSVVIGSESANPHDRRHYENKSRLQTPRMIPRSGFNHWAALLKNRFDRNLVNRLPC